MDMTDTIKPKSDQLNADDLITGPITVTIERVTKSDGDQPVAVILQGGYLPFKPCKSMRRVMVACWGNDGREWAGKSMTLYNDPEVQYGGVKVGGIRISHVSDIDQDMNIMLTTTRSKRKPYLVRRLDVKYWSDADLHATLPKVVDTVLSGKLDTDAAIARLEKTARLTADQKAKVTKSCELAKDPAPDAPMPETTESAATETATDNESIFD